MAGKKEYVKLWVSYKSYFEPYSAAEVGRLVLAMIDYRASGVEPEFSGSERFVWPAIKRDIDESLQAQEMVSKARSEAGKQGGRPKANAFNESKKNYGQGTKDKDKVKDKGQGQDNACEAVFAVMTAYMDKINPTPSQNSLQELSAYVESLGSAVCLKAIDTALDAGKANWSYIRAILRDKQARGVRCLADWERLEREREELRPKKGRQSWAELAAQMDAEEGIT